MMRLNTKWSALSALSLLVAALSAAFCAGLPFLAFLMLAVVLGDVPLVIVRSHHLLMVISEPIIEIDGVRVDVLPVATLLLKTVFEDFFNPENGPQSSAPC